MPKGIAIKVDSVSKTFKLPHEKKSSVKSLFVGMFRGKRTYERQHVLNDVSFEVKEGEFFGIVGRNGSGKSTLLKLLAGIYSPDTGAIQIEGKLTPFIELGVGFNPELTGRENIFLNGALLGFSRKDMYEMYDDIVEFAELEKFMDQKLKNYSSGMQVRLAFSIAIRAQSDIMLIDEVLAVGDEAFKQKCYDHFSNLKNNQQTIVFVSHDMEAVKKFCTRALLLSKGEIQQIGDPGKIAHAYMQLNKRETPAVEIKRGKPLIDAQIRNSSGRRTDKFNMGDMIEVTLDWHGKLQPAHAGVAVMKNTGEYMFGSDTRHKHLDLASGKVKYQVRLSLEPGKYHLVVGAFGEKPDSPDDYLYRTPDIVVLPKADATDYGLVRLEHNWEEIKSKG